MVIAHCIGVSLRGIDVQMIDVQVSLHNGMPNFNIVGLADKAIAESRERIGSVLSSIGLSLPLGRVTVNLSPADRIKEGSQFDLPIILGMLKVMQIIPSDSFSNCISMGELSLDGCIKPVSGVLPAAFFAASKGIDFVCPKDQRSEAAWFHDEITIFAPSHLSQLIAHANGQIALEPVEHAPVLSDQTSSNTYFDFAQVKGQHHAKRALEIAAAGGHNILMSGPPGSGKSMLAERLPSILPPLLPKQMLEVGMIKSVANTVDSDQYILSSTAPFRSPHHSASLPAMVGGGRNAKPGEISMAHNGVLFLDELPEFPSNVVDALRAPLENRKITVSRVNMHVDYPADILLVGAMNPCRCGYLSNPERVCSRAPICGEQYTRKISGPILDRFDIHIDVPEVPIAQLHSKAQEERSEIIRDRVIKARAKQTERYAKENYLVNARAGSNHFDQLGSTDVIHYLSNAAEKLQLSARGYYRVLRVARTIADLADMDAIGLDHIKEALSYRRMQYQYV